MVDVGDDGEVTDVFVRVCHGVGPRLGMIGGRGVDAGRIAYCEVVEVD